MVLGEWGLLPHPKIIFVLLRLLKQVHFLFIFHNQHCINFSMIYHIWVDWFLILIIDFCFRTSGSIVKLLDVVCPPERRRVIKVCLKFEWPNREKKNHKKILFVFLLYDSRFFSQSIINAVKFICFILYTCLQVSLSFGSDFYFSTETTKWWFLRHSKRIFLKTQHSCSLLDWKGGMGTSGWVRFALD